MDLKTIPLYVRAGAVIPMGPVKQYADEPSDEPLTLQVYPGADGESTWFDDDGRSFRYQHGDFALMQCLWKDSTRTLVLTRTGGSRMLEGKKIRVRLADTKAERSLTFAGHTMTITM